MIDATRKLTPYGKEAKKVITLLLMGGHVEETRAIKYMMDHTEKMADALEHLLAENEKLRELLRRYEWKGNNGSCPDCGWTYATGHPETCDLYIALEEGEPDARPQP